MISNGSSLVLWRQILKEDFLAHFKKENGCYIRADFFIIPLNLAKFNANVNISEIDDTNKSFLDKFLLIIKLLLESINCFFNPIPV